MEILIKAIDKAVRAGGVYTLDEVATILNELNKLGAIVSKFNKEKEELEDGESKKGSEESKEK